jgi:hypothetical protein
MKGALSGKFAQRQTNSLENFQSNPGTVYKIQQQLDATHNGQKLYRGWDVVLGNWRPIWEGDMKILPEIKNRREKP